jgi:two-component system, chemotaxis family, chemotaxis protein CheY
MATVQATRKMLIVDDSKAIRTLLQHLAQEMSFRSEVAVHGREALDVLDRNDPRDPFSVALVDWEMPVMIGVVLVRLLRRNHDFDNLRIMFVTQMNTPEIVEQGLGAGADEFLMKPISRESLVDKLTILGLL